MKQTITRKIVFSSKKYLIIIPIFSAIISFFTIQVPLYIGYATDGVLYNKKEVLPWYIQYFWKNNQFLYNLIILVISLIITNLIIGIFTYLRDIVSKNFDLHINKTLRMEIFKHIESLEYQTYYNYDKEEMLQRIKDDSTTYSNFFHTNLNLLLDTVFVFIFILKASIELNKTITVYILISVIILILFGLWYFKKMECKIEKMIIDNRKSLAKTIYAVTNFKMIRMLNKQKEEKEEYHKLNKEHTKSCNDFINLVLFHEIITDYIKEFATPIILMIGGVLVMKGELTLGSVIVLINFARKIMSYFIQVGNSLDEIDNFIVVSKKLNQLMNLKEEISTGKENDLDGDILLLNVTIKEKERVLLNNINLRIKKDEKIAIIGENGSGKTVLAKTILGFYGYTGNIYINHQNTKRMDKIAIRKQIGFAAEEPFIFSGTIFENIYFSKQANIDKVEKITKQVDLFNDIKRFNNGINTYVGEKGITLSGGQKQRLSLARILAQDKPILILDEAINKLDEKTKAKVFENVVLKNSKTILMITHDFKLLEKMDKVLFINGQTTFMGTHQELLKNKDYKNMMQINENII